MRTSYSVELKNITKCFPGVLANDDITLSIKTGEIRAIVGENGAGKTTLMNILYGLYVPDEGEIFIDEKKWVFKSSVDAIRAGLGMVHQHFKLFPSMTVLENIIYGSEPTHFGLINQTEARTKVQELSEIYGLQVDLDAKVGQLPVSIRQRVEIIKTLYRMANIIILDEPTAILTPQEKDGLFTILNNLRLQGKTILFITHKLNEVIEISDNATVLREGKVIDTVKTADTSIEEICQLMVGRKVALRYTKGTAVIKPDETPVLKVNNLNVNRKDGKKKVLNEVSFSVFPGEIVGIAGVAGNGQIELVKSIIGLTKVNNGKIMINENDVTNQRVSKRRELGMVYIPEDRDHDGFALRASVCENSILGYLNQSRFVKYGLLRYKNIFEHCSTIITKYSVKVNDINQATSQLSGGNLQKLVVGREFEQHGQLLIAEQPTRGVDINSTEFIHKCLLDFTQKGNAVLLISYELSEILSLADRILVMFDGEIIGETKGSLADEWTIGLWMVGKKDLTTESNLA